MSGSAPYVVAGFALTWGGLALYAWRIEARLGDALDRLERRGDGGERVEGAGRAPRGGGGEPPESTAPPEETR